METLNLVKILKGCPKRTKLYSVIHGDVTFIEVTNGGDYPIHCLDRDEDEAWFTCDGRTLVELDGECVLFPSKDNRDWSQFKQSQQTQFAKGDHILWRGKDGDFMGLFAEYAEGGNCMIIVFQGERSGCAEVYPYDLTKLEKFDQKLLHTGDAVLVRDGKDDEWSYTDFSHITKSSERQFCACGTYWRMCVPYNQETKHLIGTCYKAPKFYNLEESNI